MNKPFGLRQQIAESQSVDEVNVLLSKSKIFVLASERTKKSWKYTAERTLHRISKSDVQKTEVKKPTNSDVKKKNTNKL